MDDLASKIFMWVVFALIAPMLIGVLIGGVIFGDSNAWLAAWYMLFNLILWGLTFSGLWYFIFSAGIMSYIVVDIMIHWGELSYWSDVMHFTF